MYPCPCRIIAWTLLACCITPGTLPAQGQTAIPMPPVTTVEPAPADWQQMTPELRLANLHRRRSAPLQAELKARGLDFGHQAFIRLFKESNELELWMHKPSATNFEKFKTFRIARWSGTLGPKQKEGDFQAPEGVYGITAKRLNPKSKYHLAFNIGYPNAYDTAHGSTGSALMIHGKDVSIGCFAMTDPVIEELYLIVEAALAAGQAEVPVHCFPFRMTQQRLAQAGTENSPWMDFWRMLEPLWGAFETTQLPPVVQLGSRYTVKP